MKNGNIEEELFYVAHKFIKVFKKSIHTVIPPPHQITLILIERHERKYGEASGVNPSELSSKLKLSRSAVTQTLSILEKEGYVAREVDNDDKRKFKFIITDKGREILRTSKKESEQRVKMVLEEYGKENTKELIIKLNEFTDIMKKIDDKEGNICKNC